MRLGPALSAWAAESSTVVPGERVIPGLRGGGGEEKEEEEEEEGYQATWCCSAGGTQQRQAGPCPNPTVPCPVSPSPL